MNDMQSEEYMQAISNKRQFINRKHQNTLWQAIKTKTTNTFGKERQQSIRIQKDLEYCTNINVWLSYNALQVSWL